MAFFPGTDHCEERSSSSRPSQLVGDVQEMADVWRRVVLQQLQIRREIARQEPPADENQHCAANPEEGLLRNVAENIF